MTVFRPPAGAARRTAVSAAQQFFDDWVAGLPDRAAWFRRQAAERAGLQLDGSVASLDGAEAFVHSHLGVEVPGTAPPPWKSGAHAEMGWTDFGAALVDGLTAYVAEVLLPASGAGWRLDTDKRSAYDLQPVPSDPVVTPPWRLATGSAARFSHGIAGGSLRGQVEHVLATQAAAAPDRGLVAEVALVDDDRWDAEVQVPDAAESVLGAAAYATLEDRIAAVPGVLEVRGEDREVFLVRLSPEVGPERVRDGVQAVLDELADAAPPA